MIFLLLQQKLAHTYTLYALATGGSTTYSDISIKETNNLISNGGFDFNTTSWTATDCTTTWDNGQLKITRSGGGGLTSVSGIYYCIWEKIYHYGNNKFFWE